MKAGYAVIFAVAAISGCSAGGHAASAQGIATLPRPSPQFQAMRRDMGRVFLEERGLLSRLPEYQTGQPLAPFAASLEELCGATAGSVISANSATTLLLRLQKDPEAKLARDKLGCVLMAILGSGLEQAGIEIAFPATSPTVGPQEQSPVEPREQ